MRTGLSLFLTGIAAFWALTSGLAYLFWEGQREFVLAYSLTAVFLCAVPCVLTLVWVLWGLRQSPDLQQLAILGGSGVRMFFVLGAALALYAFDPYFQQLSFWLWVLVFYLFTLALKIIVVVRGQTLPANPQK